MEWINVKDKLPAFGEFVEVIYSNNNGMTDLNRDFAAYWEDSSGCFWTTEGMSERIWSVEGFKIKYWKPMTPDIKNRRPFLGLDRSGYFKIYMKKISEEI